MPRAGCYLALHAAVGVMVAVGPTHAQGVPAPGALAEMSVPGGLRAALAAIDDRAAPDRSQFLLEFIRRTYDMPVLSTSDPRAAARQALLAELDLASRPGAPGPSGPSRSVPDQSSGDTPSAGPPGPPDTLPLTPAIWIDVVFGGRATPQTLVRSIVGSRDASLLYSGLVSLDDDTRAWLATQPQLLVDLASRHPAAFAVAGPGLRVRNGAMRLPGGHAAEPAWEALVGLSAHDPVAFTRALLVQGDGRLAYFIGAIAQLTPAQIHFALQLDSPDAAARVAAVRRLSAVFEMVGWKVEQRTFWRPPFDPALLIADLAVDDDGQPILPGTRAFWTAVFAEADPGHAVDDDPHALADGPAVDVGWLCEQIFKADVSDQRRRYKLALFASRTVRRVTPETAHDAVVAVRAAGAYPALVSTLERARLDDIAVFANAARRAARLSAIGDDATARRAHAQFQGALSLVTRAARRGGLPSASLANAVSSLSEVDLSRRGEYEGRLVRWLMTYVDGYAREPSSQVPGAAAPVVDSPRDAYDNAVFERVAGEMDRAVLRIAAGRALAPPRFVNWEGTRYRVDLATAEANRLARLLGDDHPPYLSCARGFVVIADALGAVGLTRDALRRQADALGEAAQSVGWERTGLHGAPIGGSSKSDPPDAYREVAAALRRAARDGDVRGAARLAPALGLLADDLLARGLIDVTYAAAMGQPDRTSISAGDAATRHDFRDDWHGSPHTGPWRFPAPGTGSVPGRDWHVAGSLLGLDVALAEFSLIRLSSRPPSKRPTMNDEDRRVMTQAVALTEPAALTEADRDRVVETLRKGRDRLAAVRTPAAAAAVADEIRLAPARRTLLPWVAAHDPWRLAAFLSPIELLWLGLEQRPVDAGLQAWGGPAEPRLGCLCVQLLDRRPWETIAGRWNRGLLASGFPDLNLRLAELLLELQMPAPLLSPVLAAATIDFIENATSRDPDDRRGPVEFVQALGTDRVEQYLALLTTDGPLVPVGDGPGPGAGAVTATPGASR